MTNVNAKKWVSDFELVPIQQPWNREVATWHPDTDKQLHDLMDGLHINDVSFTKERGGKLQTCVLKQDSDKKIRLRPDDGYDFIARRVRFDNRHLDISTDSKNKQCVVCLASRRVFMVKACCHLLWCHTCTVKILNGPTSDKKCCLCKVPIGSDGVSKVFY